MKVFVTGGSGFIGSHLVERLSQHHETVVLVRDLFPTATPWGKWLSHALGKSTIVLGDVLKFELVKRVLAEYKIEAVFHMAAQAIASTAQKDPFGTFQTNVQGTVTLLEACRYLDVETIYVQSTDKVYGERMDAKETDPLVSTGTYETSKACQDLVAQSYMETYGLNVIIGRASNTFGFDMAPRIVSNTIRSCLAGNAPTIYEDDEKKIRQYIYVSDLVEAIQFLTENSRKGVFNIATDNVLANDVVVKKICNYFPITPRLAKRDKPLKEIQRQSMNWDKIKALGWRPNFSFEEGVRETIEAFQKWLWQP